MPEFAWQASSSFCFPCPKPKAKPSNKSKRSWLSPDFLPNGEYLSIDFLEGHLRGAIFLRSRLQGNLCFERANAALVFIYGLRPLVSRLLLQFVNADSAHAF